MRLVKFFALVFVLSVLIHLNSSVSCADTNDPDQVILDSYFPEYYCGYRYPVLPGMSDWKYGNHAEMVVDCDIPLDVLETMSTNQLVESILYYPLAVDVLLYDDFEIAYQVIKCNLNSFQELSGRADRIECLYEYWYLNQNNIQQENVEWQNNGCIGTHAMPSQMFAFLSKQEDFKDNNGDFYEIANSYKSNNEIYDDEAFQKANNRDITPVAFDSIVELIIDFNSYDWLDTLHATNAVKGYFPTVKERWLYSDGNYYSIIYNDLSSAAKNYIRSTLRSVYGITPYAGATVKYNCHAYAWIILNDKYTHWVNDVNPTGYNVKTMQSISNGGVVVYCESTGNSVNSSTIRSHSAIVLSKIYHTVHINTVVGFNLDSKWGMAGRYHHTMENCPYYYYPNTPYIADRLYYD